MIKPIQIHTSAAFEIRRYEGGPSVTLSLQVTTNGVDDEGNERPIDETIGLHNEALQSLTEGQLNGTLEKTGITVLMAQAEYSEPDSAPSPVHELSGPADSIHRPNANEGF